MTLLVSGCFPQKNKANLCIFRGFKSYLVLICLWSLRYHPHCEMDTRGRPKILSFVFSYKVDPVHHPANIRAQMSTSHRTKNIQDGVKACDKHVYTVTDTTTVKSTGQPYSAAAHCTLIAMWCAKNHCPFNSVLDEDYQAEVEMLCPGTILPGPQIVSHDIKSIYTKMSKNVQNYFMVTHILFGCNCYYINRYITRLLTPPFIWSWIGGQCPLLHLSWELLLCGFQMVSSIVLSLNLYG
jgi:hypothetical protein